MAASILKHQDDGGNISIFASGNVVVLSCEHGHFWVVNAEEHSKDTVKSALEDALPEAEVAMLMEEL